jgi:membrane protein
MQPVSPVSPEERARKHQVSPRHAKALEIVKRVLLGVYADGFIHAGNLAYLALLTLFPFFIVTAALAHLLGRGPDTMAAIDGVIRTLPSSIRSFLRPTILDVLHQRTGSLLWLGGLVGLWTTGSFIETIRDILRRAYGVRTWNPFWRYRFGSLVMTVGAVILMLITFSIQLALTGVEQFVLHLMPFAQGVVGWIGWSRLAPLLPLFLALYLIFYTLTPSKYRYTPCPKWPGAAFTTAWWAITTAGLPRVLALLGGYDRTYGSLAGVIVALLFFWLVGLGLVVGAQLNAALAETPAERVREAHNAAKED